MVNLLKVALPLGRAIGVAYDATDLDKVKNQIGLVEEIIKNVPELAKLDTLEDAMPQTHLNHDQQAVGSALRVLYDFLDKADPRHYWGGLQEVPTPDGNILWLCEMDRQYYGVKLLDSTYIN